MALLVLACGFSVAEAQPVLPCGQPLNRYLDAGATDYLVINLATSATTVIEVTDTSNSGTLELQVLGQEENSTCSGSLELTGPGSFTVAVSKTCDGAPGPATSYTITQNVVSSGVDNCGLPLSCGASPDGIGINVVGQVDSYTFSGVQGSQATLKVTDIAGTLHSMRILVFGPDGQEITDYGGQQVSVNLGVSGQYTVLVSPVAAANTGPYRLTVQTRYCPAGPVVTHFGLAKADGSTYGPLAIDNQGRPVFDAGMGSGFMVVIEGRPGVDGRGVGSNAYNWSADDPSVLPDMQMLVSRSLGNGTSAVCDKSLPNAGGVPGVLPPDFDVSQTVADAINDLGCRFDDGTGQARGRGSGLEACTRSDQDFGYGFVDPTTTMQFCAEVDSHFRFPPGDTVVAARLRDDTGVTGVVREIVLRVTGGCVGDCDGARVVTVDEILNCVSQALGDAPPTLCSACDGNGDGQVTVDEILQAVTNALNGCG